MYIDFAILIGIRDVYINIDRRIETNALLFFERHVCFIQFQDSIFVHHSII